jgi:hypothetical protein
MPQDKLNEQWSNDESRISNEYTSRQGQTYEKQGQRGSSSNRAHADFAYPDNQGGTSQLKPVQPDFRGLHYAQNPYEIEGDISAPRDRWNNEVPVDRSNHTPMPAGDAGQSGSRMFSDYQKVDGYTGYGVEIPHGQGAAFNNATTVWVANDRADRGPDQ